MFTDAKPNKSNNPDIAESDESIPMEDDGTPPGSHLMVKGLSLDSEEVDLRNAFGKYGGIVSVKICRNPQTLASKGFGFVNYETQNEAGEAIEHLHGKKLKGSTIRVQYARPPTNHPFASGKNPIKSSTNIYVSNVPGVYTQDDLQKLFATTGSVVQSRILLDFQGRSKRVGFVLMKTPEMAERAVASLSGSIPPRGDGPLYCKFADLKPKIDNPEDYNTLVRTQKSMAQTYGPSSRTTPSYNGGRYDPYPPTTSNIPPSQPYTYPPTSEYPQTTNPDPLYTPSSYTYQGDQPPIYPGVAPSQPVPYSSGYTSAYPYQMPQQISIFVFNCPMDATANELVNLFQNYGEVVNAHIPVDKSTGVMKGYAFVNMKRLEEATVAISAMNGYVLKGKALQVSLKTDKKQGLFQ